MQQETTARGAITATQQRLIAALFLALAAAGLGLWLSKGDSIYLNMLMTGLMNCF